MIAFPLYYFLFAYLLFLCAFIIFSLINVYHLIETGSTTVTSFIVVVSVFLLSVLTLFFTWQHIAVIDWKTPFVIYSGSSSPF